MQWLKMEQRIGKEEYERQLQKINGLYSKSMTCN